MAYTDKQKTLTIYQSADGVVKGGFVDSNIRGCHGLMHIISSNHLYTEYGCLECSSTIKRTNTTIV